MLTAAHVGTGLSRHVPVVPGMPGHLPGQLPGQNPGTRRPGIRRDTRDLPGQAGPCIMYCPGGCRDKTSGTLPSGAFLGQPGRFEQNLKVSVYR